MILNKKYNVIFLIVLLLVFMAGYFIGTKNSASDKTSTSSKEVLATKDKAASSSAIVTNALALKNEFNSVSSLESADINNDGIDEIIFRSRSMSWWNKTYVLKVDENKSIVPYCRNCDFSVHASDVVFKDIDGDKDLDAAFETTIDSKRVEHKYIFNDGNFEFFEEKFIRIL